MPGIRERRLHAFVVAFALSVACVALSPATPSAASEVKYVVNGVPVTSYDIQRRAAFLKLQNKKGNLNALAGEEMVDDALKAAEIRRLNIRITDAAVDAAFARFAEANKMPPKQMGEILDKMGVTQRHFKDFIRSQMGWSQALSSRFRSQGGALSEQDVVRKMLEKGGSKPSATEYMLQQVIFVVPAAERKSTLGARKREAEAMRGRFVGCDTTRQFAKGLIDVTVRDLGRFLAPDLPTDWAESIKSTKAGQATSVRETDRGVEFIGICSSREVSDDRVARSVFQAEAAASGDTDELDKNYLAELRKRAKIVQR